MTADFDFGIQGQAPAESSTQAPSSQGQPSEAAPAPQGGILTSMAMPLLLCAVVFYFLVLGPERKQRKKRDVMLKALAKGDKVMTTGGIYASVVAVADDVVTLQIADGVRTRFSRSAIQSVISDDAPATEKASEKEPALKR